MIGIGLAVVFGFGSLFLSKVIFSRRTENVIQGARELQAIMGEAGAAPGASAVSALGCEAAGVLSPEALRALGQRLEDDEAMVVTATDGGAAFRDFVLHDVFYLSIEYWNLQTSLNAGQMAADADGRHTFVIAHEDPGVHNWLDTGGLHEIFALHRWQGLPNDGAAPPQITSEVVPLKDLARALPQGVRTVTATERAAQLERRRREFTRRFEV